MLLANIPETKALITEDMDQVVDALGKHKKAKRVAESVSDMDMHVNSLLKRASQVLWGKEINPEDVIKKIRRGWLAEGEHKITTGAGASSIPQQQKSDMTQINKESPELNG